MSETWMQTWEKPRSSRAGAVIRGLLEQEAAGSRRSEAVASPGIPEELPMPHGPRTPVLVGAASVSQRAEDPREAKEPLLLMAEALERAAHDAGSLELLGRADSIRVPRGFWDYPDPGRALAERFGAGARARTCVAEIGVLQTTLLGAAARDIAAGRADVVLVAGGEARHRAQRAQQLGVPAPLARLPEREPDEVLRPHAEIVSPLEVRVGLASPVSQYAVIENALRAAEKQSLAAHRDAVAALQERASRVAAANPDAWDRRTHDAAEIRGPVPGNRMLAFPYTKLHTSQWNVDQAAGLILCSLETARALGLDARRFVYPLAVADANHMVPLAARPAPWRVPGFAHAGRLALAHAELSVAELGPLELYSCFPIAVRAQARELGIDEAQPLTVTGGMTFAGGPLNNFVLQALVKLALRLRAAPERPGLLTAVSGILTKQGVSLWSAQPPARDFAFLDATAETAAEQPPRALVDAAEGPARAAGYTVLFDGERAARTALVCELPDGRRTLAASDDPALAELGTREELTGRALRLVSGGVELL
jgi:acetyl-CoA C-acetyltransferase